MPRGYPGTATNLCKCGQLRAPSKRYCKSCHNAYMRGWRVTHRLSGEARIKMISRSYANVYERRGKLVKQPCKICGDENSQKHHADYSKPLEVEWLCRKCHLNLHKFHGRNNREMADGFRSP